VLPDKAILRIRFEIEKIDQLMESVSPLFHKVLQVEPDFVEISAIAQNLQSFYNGIENILSLIIKGLGIPLPTSKNWHREMLRITSETAIAGIPLLPPDLLESLINYLVCSLAH
jgi:hypothetical protein